MHISVTGFGGEIPRLADHRLPDGKSVYAQNMKLTSGGIRPWHKPLVLFSPSIANIKSFYRMPYSGGDKWLCWVEDVYAIPGAVSNDTDYKTYYAGQATPRKTNYTLATNAGTTTTCPNDYLELGVPAPTVAPSLAVVGGAATNVTRTYFETFVTTWLEESKPGPTVIVTGHPDGSWNLTGLNAAPAGKYSMGTRRIYRSLQDSYGNTQMMQVAEIAIGTTTYNDTVADAALGIICPSTSYDLPPTDLSNLTALPNGVMAGISASTKQVCFCEPYKPHAWPQAYRYATEYTPVGLAAVGNSVLVGTTGAPYIMDGTHPSVMSSTKLASTESCLAARSVFSLGFGAIYASPNGFVLATPGSTDLASREWFSRYEWQIADLTTMKITKYDDMIFFFYKNVADESYSGKFLDKKLDELGRLNSPVDFAWTDPLNGNLYILQQNTILQWDGNTADYLQADWKSKRYIMQHPINFGAAVVDADWTAIISSTQNNANLITSNQGIWAIYPTDLSGSFNENQFNGSGPNSYNGFTFNGGLQYDLTAFSVAQYVQFTLWVKGVVKFIKNVTSSEPFRLPAGYKSLDYNVELSGTIPINYVKVAETMKELTQV